jgi:hypothetical protein
VAEFEMSDAEAEANVPPGDDVAERVAEDRSTPGDISTLVENDEGAPDDHKI